MAERGDRFAGHDGLAADGADLITGVAGLGAGRRADIAQLGIMAEGWDRFSGRDGLAADGTDLIAGVTGLGAGGGNRAGEDHILMRAFRRGVGEEIDLAAVAVSRGLEAVTVVQRICGGAAGHFELLAAVGPGAIAAEGGGNLQTGTVIAVEPSAGIGERKALAVRAAGPDGAAVVQNDSAAGNGDGNRADRAVIVHERVARAVIHVHDQILLTVREFADKNEGVAAGIGELLGLRLAAARAGAGARIADGRPLAPVVAEGRELIAPGDGLAAARADVIAVVAGLGAGGRACVAALNRVAEGGDGSAFIQRRTAGHADQIACVTVLSAGRCLGADHVNIRVIALGRRDAGNNRQVNGRFSGVLIVVILNGEIHRSGCNAGNRECAGRALRDVDGGAALNLRNAAAAERSGEIIGRVRRAVGHVDGQRIADMDRGRLGGVARGGRHRNLRDGSRLGCGLRRRRGSGRRRRRDGGNDRQMNGGSSAVRTVGALVLNGDVHRSGRETADRDGAGRAACEAARGAVLKLGNAGAAERSGEMISRA